MNHKARQVGQALGNAVLLAGQATDGPAHPALGGGVDRIRQVRSGVQAVENIVGKVSAVAAVQEGSDRLKGLVSGVRDRGHRNRPGGFGLIIHRAPKAPGFVLGGRDVGGDHDRLRVCVGDDSIDALFPIKAKALIEKVGLRGSAATSPDVQRTGRYVDVHITPVMLRPYLCDPRLVSH